MTRKETIEGLLSTAQWIRYEVGIHIGTAIEEIDSAISLLQSDEDKLRRAFETGISTVWEADQHGELVDSEYIDESFAAFLESEKERAKEPTDGGEGEDD